MSTMQAKDLDANSLTPVRGKVAQIEDNGTLTVLAVDGRVFRCECLHALGGAQIAADKIGSLAAGDSVLVLPPSGAELAIVLGRVGPMTGQAPAETLSLEASRNLTLRCGQSSLEMRADGKVLIRGEDVLVRAKGTKRIRAGTVSIN